MSFTNYTELNILVNYVPSSTNECPWQEFNWSTQSPLSITKRDDLNFFPLTSTEKASSHQDRLGCIQKNVPYHSILEFNAAISLSIIINSINLIHLCQKYLYYLISTWYTFNSQLAGFKFHVQTHLIYINHLLWYFFK